MLAEYYSKLRDRDKAMVRLEASWGHAPLSAFVHYQAGMVHAILEDYGRAVEELRTALDLGDVGGRIRQAPELRGLRESDPFRQLQVPLEAPR